MWQLFGPAWFVRGLMGIGVEFMKRSWTLSVTTVVMCVMAAGAFLGCGESAQENTPLAIKGRKENATCLDCHETYRTEKLSLKHQRKGVTCATCHGESVRHADDADSLTPPDIMYPRETVKAACLKCHSPAKLSWKGAHKPVFSSPPGTTKTCTDCHGEHRIKGERTREWDKSSGKLLKQK